MDALAGPVETFRPQAALKAGLSDAQRSFASVLGRAQADGHTAPERARDAAEQLVAQTFVQPMLKELRESSRAAPPFAPTQAERQFRALMDAELAQRLVSASRFPLVDRLARDLLKGQTALNDSAPQTRELRR